ncbi:MAG: tetratricopeptide repeat protein, partial [Blastocatellia bacterium]
MKINSSSKVRAIFCVACLLVVLCAQAGAQESREIERGNALEARGEFAQAKGIYLSGLAQFSKSGELSFRAGTIYLREADWPHAIQYLEQARGLRPRHVETLYYLAQAYYLDGQQRIALDTIGRAARLAPDRPEVAQKYGQYLCEANQCTEGLRYLLKARRLNPTLENIDFDLGMAYHKQAAVPEAQRYLEAAFKRDPGNLAAARFLADVLGREAQWDRAKDLYQFVVAGDPRDAWALYGLGRAWIGLGQHETAIGPLRDAIAANPRIAEPHFQLGQALRQLGNMEESQRELALFQALRDRLQSATSSERTPFENRIWDECLRLLTTQREADALAYLNSLKAAPAPVKPHYLIGALYYNLNRFSDAVRMFTQAAAASPGDSDVLASLGRAYVADGQRELAERELARARALNPKGEIPLVGMGELEYARGNCEQAIRFFGQSKTAQVPALLKLCRAYLCAGARAKALEIAELVRVYSNG